MKTNFQLLISISRQFGRQCEKHRENWFVLVFDIFILHAAAIVVWQWNWYELHSGWTNSLRDGKREK